MIKFIQNRLLFHTNCSLACFVIICLITMNSCKNRVKRTEVFVFNTETHLGIPNISIYHKDNKYVTDTKGKVIIEGKGNLKGTKVSAAISTKGFITPNFSQTCTLDNTYEIQSEFTPFPLEPLSILKLNIKLPPNANNHEGCYVLDDLLKCEGQIAQYYELDERGFEYPTESSYITFYITNSNEPVSLSLFYGMQGGCESTSKSPDQVEQIPMDPNNDTTYYTVQLR